MGAATRAGVVVNDSLVLLDMVNRLRADGRSPFDAAFEAGGRRFRPLVREDVLALGRRARSAALGAGREGEPRTT